MVIPPDLEQAVELEIIHRMFVITPGFDPDAATRLTPGELAALIAKGVAAGLAKVQAAEERA